MKQPNSRKQESEARNRLQAIYEEIRERICFLDYAPGSRVSEAELCEEFGLSRTPIRRVLVRLETEGFIETHHGDGTYVTTVAPDLLDEVYQLRIELASLMGRLNPIQPSKEILQRLRTTHDAILDLVGKPDVRRYAELNVRYYLSLTELIGNRPLREICEKLFIQTSRIWLVELPRLDWDEVMRATCEEISHVISALERGDVEAAALFSRLNIQRTRARFIRSKLTDPSLD